MAGASIRARSEPTFAPMRTSFLLCMLLHAVTASASQLTVEAPLIKVVNSRVDLRELCRLEGHYDACTAFVGFRLEASCALEGDAWKVSASARFRPWIFLDNISRLSHEHEHIADVRQSLESHLAMLEGMRFGSEAACRAKILDESAAFGTAMRDWALRSNLEHHPRLASRRLYSRLPQ